MKKEHSHIWDCLKSIYLYLFLLCMGIVVAKLINNYMILVIPILILLFWISGKFKIFRFPLILFCVGFLLRLLFIKHFSLAPTSDFAALYEAAGKLIQHDYSFLTEPYFQIWGFQLPFVWIESLFLRINHSVVFLQVINAAVSSFIGVMIYYIAKEISNEKSARICGIFYMILLMPIAFTIVLSNQHLATLFLLLGIYILIKKKFIYPDYVRFIIAGLLLAIGNVVRPEGIVILISLLLYFILIMTKINWKWCVRGFLVVLITYVSCGFLFDVGFRVSGLAPHGLTSSMEWKFVLGLNSESCGSYNRNDEKYVQDKEASRQVIWERLHKSPYEYMSLFSCKITRLWSTATMGLLDFHEIPNKFMIIMGFPVTTYEIIDQFHHINDAMFGFGIILMIIGLFYYRKVIIKEKKEIIFLFTIVFVTFGVYLFIEVQPRYIYFVQTVIVILASLGIDWLTSIKERTKNRVLGKDK